MEVYYYVCKVCGYVHQVPAYWVNYAPEEEMDMPHINLSEGDVCESSTLAYKGEQA